MSEQSDMEAWEAMCEDASERQEADARALWAVRVLDAWQLARPHRGYMTSPLGVTLYGVADRATYHDRDPDVSRIAAAEALVAADPSLGPK